MEKDDHGPVTDALWQCWELLNSHRAARGPTYGTNQEYMDLVLSNAEQALGDFCKPWHPNYVRKKRKEDNES